MIRPRFIAGRARSRNLSTRLVPCPELITGNQRVEWRKPAEEEWLRQKLERRARSVN